MKNNESARLNNLLSINPENVSAPALKAALQERRRREEQAQAEKLVGQLENARNITVDAVKVLRHIRRQEQLAQTYVLRVNDAENKFHKTGDYTTYLAEVSDAQRKHQAGLSAK